jgi:hypothetical protein
MTLRLYAAEGEPAAAPSAEPRARTGTQFLAARRRRLERSRQVPEIASLRELLAPLVRASRCRRLDRPPLVATVYDLVPHGAVDEYRRLVGGHGELPVRLRLSGPWPPWAFGAPE